MGQTFCDIASDLASSDFNVQDFLSDFTPEFPVLSLWELKRSLFKVNTKSSSGPDSITVNALRKFFLLKPDTLLQIMQSSLEEFPESWKSAWIHPIPKAVVNTFRPIALLSQLSKLLERIVALHFDYSFKTPTTQYGCVPGVDVEMVLPKFSHEFLLRDDEFGLVLFDIRKAFDRVIHFAGIGSPKGPTMGNCFLVSIPLQRKLFSTTQRNIF